MRRALALLPAVSLALSLHALAQPAEPELPAGARLAADLRYGDAHERQALDLYWLPDARAPTPVVVCIHGGGWQQGSKEGCARSARDLLPHGYAVAAVNYRLSQHAVFPAQIADVQAAVRWLRAHADAYNLDPERFGAWGGSAGGHLAALLGTAGDAAAWAGGGHLDQSSGVQAVVDRYGPTDFLRMNDRPGRMDHDAPDSPESRLVGGPIQEHPERVQRANPITYVTPDDPPFFIMHGRLDELVPYEQSELLHTALVAAGVPSRLVLVDTLGHGGAGWHALVPDVIAFFDRHLKPEPPRGALIEVGDAETNDLSPWREPCSNSGGARCPEPTTEVVREGRYALKMVREAGDQRNEVGGARASLHTPHWYGWSLYIDPDEYEPHTEHGLILSQIHHYQGENRPSQWHRKANFTLQQSEGRLRLGHGFQPEHPKETVRYNGVDLGPAEPGRWIDFVVHAKWTWRDNGFVRMWRDGRLVYTYDGPTYFDYGPNTQGPYFKAGLYHGDWRTDHATRDVVYVDAYRLGGPEATCADVAPDPSVCAGTEPPAPERLTVGGDAYAVRWLARDDFSDDDWRERWTVETGTARTPGARVWVEDGRLQVDDPEASEGVTLWHRAPVPADFALRVRVHVAADSPEGTAVVFAAARDSYREPLRVGARDGDYESYQAKRGDGIEAYLASLTLGHARLRLLPAFDPPLASNEAVGTARGATHEVVLVVHDGRVRYYLDGQKLYDVAIEEPLPGGHVALRNWHTRAWWDDVALGAVVAAEPLDPTTEGP